MKDAWILIHLKDILWGLLVLTIMFALAMSGIFASLDDVSQKKNKLPD